MADISNEWVRKRASPLIQFTFAVLLGWFGMGMCKLLHKPPGAEFFAAFLAIILFCFINILVSFAYDSFLRYTMPGIYLYVILVMVLFYSAKSLSGISIWTQFEYKMMLVSVSIFYFMASFLVRGARLIIQAAEEEQV
ncbi:MAG TPA: hypothetical protein VK154_15720 [Chitinophagales bacterium]|nr:hypothetical protein [Chitinophagales bacterium]